MKSANNFNKHNFKNELEETKHNFLTSFQNLLHNKLQKQNASKYRMRGGGLLQNQIFPCMPGAMPMCLQTNSPVMYMPSLPSFQQHNVPVVVCSPVAQPAANSCGSPTFIVTLPNAPTAPPPVRTTLPTASPAPAPAPPPAPVRAATQKVPPRPAPRSRPHTAPNLSVKQKPSLGSASPSPPKPFEFSKKPHDFSHLGGKVYVKEGKIVPWPEEIYAATPMTPRDYTPKPGESWMKWTDAVQTPKSPVRVKQATPPRMETPVLSLTVEPVRGDGDESAEGQLMGVPVQDGQLFASLGCSSLSDLNISPEEIAQNILNMTGSQIKENEGLAAKEAKEKANLAKLIQFLHERRHREIAEMMKDAMEGRLPVGMKDNTARF
ncbi:putative uncharacterized protein DDB_G0290521 [Tribolium castaneum]|uniref:putative uncharacterized protein DDB_G0290521 n=1 Tax=Tribolium castaneum TaxID=7070 RepID=UPI00046C3B56|nr:PREDICTED: leucine-rich repeat extensin-like protein 5 [Tribolium castaneum]|eukprot:XP_008197813.1 PREDICTED: leucine-rich repeat extensin-like protein 5 [Tribolium castaneum]